MEFSDRRFPPRLVDIEAAGLQIWADAYEAVDDPRLRSRLGDLLWLRKMRPRPDLRGRGAAEAMIELSRDPAWNSMDATEGLTRALEITREMRDRETQARVVARMVEATREELERGDERPGIPLRLLESLTLLPEAERPSDLPVLLDEAHRVYGSDPWHADSILELRTQLAGAEEREQLQRTQVELWRSVAGSTQGIVRAAHLEHALELARNFGLVDAARDLRVEIQEIREEDLDLKTSSVEIPMPKEEVARYIDAFLAPSTLEEALLQFGVHGPPGGEPDALSAQVTRQMAATPLQYLITKVIIDPDRGIPIFKATDEATHLRAAIAQQRQFAAQIWSVFALEILERIKNHYGRPSHQDLTAAFVSDVVDESLAERFARALELLWDGYADESAHIAAPRLEAGYRELARRIGLPIINEPRGEETGGVRTLGVLLDAMTASLPSPGWHAYLKSLLADPLGPNLRNVVAHGLRTSVAAEDAALLIHAACFLCSLRLVPPPDG